jgi:hypothetical protein
LHGVVTRRTVHGLRRFTYLPALLLADTIVMFSPLVERQTRRRPARRLERAQVQARAAAAQHRSARRHRAVPSVSPSGKGPRGRAARHRPFRIDLSGKQPNALLGIGAILAERGESPLIVYIGSFIRGMDRVEERFYARAAELGIPIQSLSPAMQSRTTKHSGCSARSTPSAICSTKA